MKRQGYPSPTNRHLVSSFWQCCLLLLVSLPFFTEARSPFVGPSKQRWGQQRIVIRGGHLDSQGNSPPPPPESVQAGTTASYFSNPSHHPDATGTTTTPTATTTANNTEQTANSTTNQTAEAATNNSSNIPEWKQRLPEPLRSKKPRTLQRICVPYQNQVAEIYLLGTAHVSNDSSRDVKLLLQTLEPDVIFVELCDQRTSLMEDPPEALQSTLSNATKPFWQKVNEIQLQTNNSKFQCMATVLLTQTQEEYADSLGVELGGEFRVAYQYWRSFRTNAYNNNYNNHRQSSSPSAIKRPHLILGDRPLAITLARCWESLSWFGKIKVVVGLLVSSFSKPDPDELRAWIQKILQDDEMDLLKASLEDLRKHFPTLERVIIQERDAYMACKLYQLCRGMLVKAARQQQPTSYYNYNNNYGNGRIVIAALVGAGHVPGICEWLTNKSHPQTPEEMLANLIATKKFQNDDLSQLVFDVTELQDLPPTSTT